MTNEENKNIEIEAEATEPVNETVDTPVAYPNPAPEEKDTHVRDGIVAGVIAGLAAVAGVASSIVGAIFTKKSKDAFSK